ncbi:ATP-binding protein [Planctomycetota bacterium]
MDEWVLTGHGGASWSLPYLPAVVGRQGSPGINVALLDARVSRRHAELREDGSGGVLLCDLGSRNGTYLNGRRIRQAEPVVEGDTIRIGSTELELAREVPGESTSRSACDSAFDLGHVTCSIPYEELAGLLAEEAKSAAKAGESGQAQMGLLYELGQSVAGLRDPKDIVDAVTSIASDLLRAERVGVYEASGDDELRRLFGIPGGPAEVFGPDSPAESVVRRALDLAEAVIYDRRRRRAADPVWVRRVDSAIRSAVAVPLTVAHRTLGVLYAETRHRDRPLDSQSLELLGAIGLQAAASLEAARRFRDSERAQRELDEANSRLLEWSSELEHHVEERTREIALQKREIEELLANKNDLFRMAAHDLRSPLSSIVGYAQIAETDVELGDLDAAGESLATILALARRMAFLVDDLLTAESIRSGQIVVRRRPTDLSALLKRTVSSMSVQARERNVSLEAEVDCGTELASLDPDRVGQVLDNLVANAIKALSSGGRVLVRARRDGDAVLLEVEDNGPGLDQAQLARLGQVTHLSGHDGAGGRGTGFGLGLSIANKLAGLMGAHLTVVRSSDAGTTLVLRIDGAFQ